MSYTLRLRSAHPPVLFRDPLGAAHFLLSDAYRKAGVWGNRLPPFFRLYDHRDLLSPVSRLPAGRMRSIGTVARMIIGGPFDA